MGTNTLTERSDGQIITQDWFNDLNLAMRLDWLPRNASNVPTNLAGSIGSPSLNWLTGYFQSLVVNGTTLDTSLLTSLPNRIVSCKVTAEDFPDYLTAGGTSNLNAVLDATGVAFHAVIADEDTTLTADITFPVTAGYTSNHTMAINEASWTGASAAEQQALVFGEQAHRSVYINFDAVGTNITNLGVGAKAFFRGVNTSAAVEHIYGEIIAVSGSTIKLRVIWRAIKAGESRIKFRDNDVWTLCRPTFLFIDGDGAHYETNVTPVKVDTLPSPATAGKYINRLSDDTWWFDDGSNPLTPVDRIFVGVALSHNGTDNGAVCYLPEWRHYKSDYLDMKQSDVNITIHSDPVSASKGHVINGKVKLGLQTTYYDDKQIATSTAGDLESGTADISAIGVKYIYRVYSTGKLVYSDIMPRKYGQGVFIHPTKMWRCIGFRMHSATAFYYGSQNGEVFQYPGIVLTASVGNTMANYNVFSGYCPSWMQSLITDIDHGATTAVYGADYYDSTTDRVIGTGTTYQFISALAPLFSGYVRIRGSSSGANSNHMGYISGMGHS